MNETHDPRGDNTPPPVPPQPSAPQQPAPPQQPQGFPHPQPPPPGRPAAPPPPPGAAQDDVWGVRPPALGGQPTGYPQDGISQPGHGQSGYGQGGYGQGGYGTPGPGSGQGPGTGSHQLDRGFSALQKSPLRRDTDDGIVGGVAAGIAKQLNVSTGAVRIATIALSLFFGSGIAAYLIAWTLLPDQSGRTHVEQGIKGGNGQSLVISVLGGLATLGMLGTILDGIGWLIPIAVTAGLVYYVVSAARKKGDGTAG